MATGAGAGTNGNGYKNGTLVGGWAGNKDHFRSEEFKNSGGAPYPKEFILSITNFIY